MQKIATIEYRRRVKNIKCGYFIFVVEVEEKEN